MPLYTDFINELCQVLNIKPPKISYNGSHFPTDTTLAQCDSEGSTIYLKRTEKPNLDCFFAIAHELRHVWQIALNKDLYFAKYKPREQCGTVNDYALQIAEIEANAFAGIIMVNYFDVKPLFNEYSQEVKNAIYDRMKYLTKNI